MLFVMMSLVSCSKEDIADDDIIKDIPFNGYIQFGEEAQTRASSENALEDLTGQDFGVIAFKYSSDWNTYKATGTPTRDFLFPTLVYYKNTSWTYDKSNNNKPANPTQVEWDNASRYSFFAYYPYSGPGSCITTVTNQNTAGVPSIKYTTPFGPDLKQIDPSDLKDVMIASVKDAKNNADGTIYFNFKHCLSCLTVEARNLDEKKADDSSDQTITNLSLTITSPIYNTLTIPLDYTLDPTAGISDLKSGNKTYIISGNNPINVPPISVTEGDPQKGKIQVVSVSGNNNVFIIPQKANDANTGHLRGYVTFTAKDGVKTGEQGKAGYDKSLEFDSDKDFAAGRKYSLIVNFANGMISVAIVESGDWTDKDIIHSFE